MDQVNGDSLFSELMAMIRFCEGEAPHFRLTIPIAPPFSSVVPFTRSTIAAKGIGVELMPARKDLTALFAHRDATEKVIGCAFRVYNRKSYGFAESVYERCLIIELKKLGLHVEQQKPITVQYEGKVVGEFIADLFVEDALLVELKSIRTLAPAHEAQLVNYLVATGIDLGLLLNFGENGVEIKRKLRVLPTEQAVATQQAGSTSSVP